MTFGQNGFSCLSAVVEKDLCVSAVLFEPSFARGWIGGSY